MKRLLCEGLDGAFYPESIRVYQGAKVCILKGDKTLSESEGVQLVESLTDLELVDQIVEGTTVQTVKDGKWIFEGPFQRSDTENANKRKYPRKVWEKIVGEKDSPSMRRMSDGGMLGHLEHPEDGRTDGNKGALVVRSLKLQEDGVVWGSLELLDTPSGRILQEYTRKGVRWGVSSRGNGSVGSDGSVNEDYALETFDAVMRPSTPGAFPEKTKKKTGTNESTETDPSALETVCESFIASVNAVDLPESVDAFDDLAPVYESLGTSLKTTSKALQEAGDTRMSAALESLSGVLTALAGASTRIGESVDAKIAKAIHNASSSDAGICEAEFETIISGLHERLAAYEDTATKSSTNSDESRIRLIEASGELALTRRQLSETEGELDEIKAQLSAATSTIAEMTASQQSTEDKDLCEEAVTEAILSDKRLEPFRDLLESAGVPDDIMALADRLSASLAVPVATKPNRILEAVSGNEQNAFHKAPRSQTAVSESVERDQNLVRAALANL